MPKPVNTSGCSVDGCDRSFHAIGFCAFHYNRVRIHGDPLTNKKPPRSPMCRVSGCIRASQPKRSICARHRFNKINRGSWFSEPVSRTKSFGCSVKDCAGAHVAKGLCKDHWTASRRATHREQINKRSREWKRNHPWADRDRAHRRRVRMRGARVERVPFGWLKVLRADPCSYCGNAGGSIDHVQPIKLLGSHTADNLAGSCQKCNQKKSARPLLMWLLRSA